MELHIAACASAGFNTGRLGHWMVPLAPCTPSHLGSFVWCLQLFSTSLGSLGLVGHVELCVPSQCTARIHGLAAAQQMCMLTFLCTFPSAFSSARACTIPFASQSIVSTGVHHSVCKPAHHSVCTLCHADARHVSGCPMLCTHHPKHASYAAMKTHMP
jgi:hypothetical protein